MNEGVIGWAVAILFAILYFQSVINKRVITKRMREKEEAHSSHLANMRSMHEIDIHRAKERVADEINAKHAAAESRRIMHEALRHPKVTPRPFRRPDPDPSIMRNRRNDLPEERRKTDDGYVDNTPSIIAASAFSAPSSSCDTSSVGTTDCGSGGGDSGGF